MPALPIRKLDSYVLASKTSSMLHLPWGPSKSDRNQLVFILSLWIGNNR